MQHRLQLRALARHQLGDVMLAHLDAAIARQRLEHPDVVIPEVPVEVVGRRQLDPVVRQRLLKCVEMKGLAIGDDTVEVEDDRLKMVHPE